MRCVRVLLLFSVFGVALPSRALADGMAFHRVGATTEIEATAQRAVMWLRNGTWEIHIQPHFYREQGSVAWVVPFPVRPTIQEGTADFFDDLEIVTSPVFMTRCHEESGGGGCGTLSSGDGDSGSLKSGEGHVRIWERGTVGQLDYVILSAGDGDSLVQWLTGQDYVIPPGAQTLLSQFDTDESFFFAARLSENADPEKPVSPVRFIMPDMNTPAYPLRMTGLGAPAGKFLDLTVWVIVPDDQQWLPDNHSYGQFAGNPGSREEYDQALDDVFNSRSSDYFVLLYADIIGTEFPEDYRRCEPDDQGYPTGDCVALRNMGIDLPEQWSGELTEVGGGDYEVYRFQARLDADAMAKDLILAQPQETLDFNINNVYSHDIGRCPGPWSCSVVGGTGILGILFALLVLTALALLRRRR